MWRGMIEPMASPFRRKKKERKRWRRSAKKAIVSAEKFETGGTKPEAAAGMQRLASFRTRMAGSKRKTKAKHFKLGHHHKTNFLAVLF